MKKSLLFSLGALALSTGLSFASSVKMTNNPLPLHEKIAKWNVWNKEANKTSVIPSLDAACRFAAPQPEEGWNDVNGLGIVELPDGSYWYYTANYEYKVLSDNGIYVDRTISRFEYNFYNSALEYIGTVADDIEYYDGEIRIVGIDLASILTKKFFNYNDNYEIMVSLSVNKEGGYGNTDRVLVYSVGGNKDANGDDVVIWQLDNMLFADYVNAAQDEWSENFYLTFMNEMDDPTIEDYFESYKVVMQTFSKATYNDGPQMVNQTEIIYSHMPGDMENTPCMFSWAEGGRAYFLFQQYEKRFFTDPTGGTDDDSVLPDNYLLADVYSITTGDTEFSLETNVRIPARQDNPDYLWTFYSIGNLDYRKDVIHNNGEWEYVLTKQYYSPQSEETFDTYLLVDGEGEVKTVIFELAENKIRLGDIYGLPTQFAFITQNSDYSPDGALGYNFSFVNVPSGEEMFTVSSNFDGLGLTTTMGRVLSNKDNASNYAIVTNTPKEDNNGNVLDRILWLNSDGTMMRVDEVNLGVGVQYALPYITTASLSPYYFNTDARTEYMYLVKRLASDGNSLPEELLIVNPDGNRLLECGPGELGVLRSIIPVDNGADSKLEVIYYNDDTETYASEFYPLPLSKFNGGGDGSEENPYMIETVGDLHEIGSGLNLHYRLANDINAAGYLFTTLADDFTGSLDGDGHIIKNLDILASEYGGGIFNRMTSATVKDVTFTNVRVNLTDDNGYAGTIAGAAVESVISNVHINGLSVEGSPVPFGGLVGEAFMKTSITGSSVCSAEINDMSSVGGIVGNIRTACVIDGCLFTGSINGGREVGGIVAGTVSGDEVITNCHVNAELTALNTVGGIIGSSKRSKVANCYVEGSIVATTDGYNGPCAGGIVGYLEPNFSENGNVPVIVNGNIVNLDSLEGPATDNTSVHRIIGWSKSNLEEDENGAAGDELGLADNYCVVAVVSDNIAYNNAAGIEGAEITEGNLNQPWLGEIGFLFGDNISAPWMINSDDELVLYYESDIAGISKAVVSKSVIKFANGILRAEGCAIQVFSLNGMKVAEGIESLDISALAKGVYITIATMPDGKLNSLKINR